jgi:hypothetical protein
MYNKSMRDLTGYPLSPSQRKEVEEYMNNHNVSENEARYALGYVPLDLPRVSVTEALEMVKEENPNVELTKETLKFYLDEVMKKCIPKPNPKFASGILIKNMNEELGIRPMTEEEIKEWIDNLDGSLLFRQHLTWEEVRKACIRFLKLNDEICHEIELCDDGIDVLTFKKLEKYN